MVAAIAPQTLIELGQQEAAIKYQEDYAGGTWTNVNKYAAETPGMSPYQGQSWCLIGLLWLAHRAGDVTIMPQTPACDVAVSTYQSWSRWSWYPAVGAQVMLGSGGAEHTALVYRYDSAQIWTIEFNSNNTGSSEGDGVYLRVRNRSDPKVYGYGYPKYAAPMVTSDPNWVDDPALLKISSGSAAAYAPYPGPDWFRIGRTSPLALASGKRLVAVGAGTFTPSADIGQSDLNAWGAWHTTQGSPGGAYPGYPGETIWRALQVPHSH
ncbi:hypothetical protein [Streptomyces seoulensis]|uniref:hypothetical protein n=1 Tax=Streptomyces seoulensis TaxID=73044 RepID=UPI001FCAA2B2|nr:hypothetical protein [Streptomyces seoulensis]BDH04913.1 hypothetical protein HEK131_21400 [Streptomyces seoulensis]